MKKYSFILAAVMVILLTSTACSNIGKAPEPTPAATANPTSASTPSATPAPEKVWLNLSQINEINKVFSFGCKGEIPRVRAMGMKCGLYTKVEDIDLYLVAKRMANPLFKYRYLDKENSFLTAEDTAELEYLKEHGEEKIYEDVVEDNAEYARVLKSELKALVKEYTGLDYFEFTRKPQCFKYNDKEIIYVRYAYPIEHRIMGGYIQGDTVRLYSCENVGIDDAKYVMYMKKQDDKYYITGYETEELDDRHNVYLSENGDTTYYIYKYQPRTVYFYNDNSKSQYYNDALRAYGLYLKNAALSQYYLTGISSYGIYDITGDNIPDLVLSLREGPFDIGYKFCTYNNGKIVEIPRPSYGFMHGPMRIMKNGMVGLKHTSTGVRYNFYQYHNNGTYNLTEFSRNTITDTEVRYAIGEKTVTKEEYNNFSKYYLTEFEKEADIKFNDIYEEILY